MNYAVFSTELLKVATRLLLLASIRLGLESVFNKGIVATTTPGLVECVIANYLGPPLDSMIPTPVQLAALESNFEELILSDKGSSFFERRSSNISVLIHL